MTGRGRPWGVIADRMRHRIPVPIDLDRGCARNPGERKESTDPRAVKPCYQALSPQPEGGCDRTKNP